VEWRLVDDEGGPVPPGDGAGELLLRGPWIASNYFKNEHPESFDNGWLRSGDIATADGSGFLHIVDRAKDLIKSGGEWISSVALERALVELPGVREAAVVATPDERWGERPAALVVPEVDGGVDEATVLAGLRDALPRWWLPEHVWIVDGLPRTSVGKIDKKALRTHILRRLSAPTKGR
jgi:fatty-acyl-CoA synthase